MPASLSIGSLSEILNGIRVVRPVLQLLALKKLTTPGVNGVICERYRLLLSDGANSFTFAMLATQLNCHIRSGHLNTYAIIRLDNYAINCPQPDKKVLVVLDLVILNSGAEVGRQIGNPLPYGYSSNQENRDANPQDSHNAVAKNTNNFEMERSIKKEPVPVGNATPPSKVNVCGFAAKQRKLHSIKNLTTCQNGWTIRARVTNKTPFRNWSNSWWEIKFFTVDLLDESGEIYAVCFSDKCTQFYDKLVVSKLYYISNANVRTADKNFSPNMHPCEITFKAETLVEPCEDRVDAIPFINFGATVPIGKLVEMEKNTITNVIGVCKRYSELQAQACRTVNREAKKRDIYLVDKSNIEVALTVFDADAERFNGSDHPIIAVKGVRISDFGGCSLCATPLTMLLINPVTKEANDLREWFISEGSHSATNSISKIGSDVFDTKWKCLQQAKLDCLAGLDKDVFFFVKAVVDYTTVQYSMYRICPTPACNSKVVTRASGYYRCENCNQEFDKSALQFSLDIKILDFSGSVWITCLEECADTILEVTPKEIGYPEPLHYPEFEKSSHMSCKSFIFKLHATMENFQDNSSLKVNAVSVTPVEFLDYNKKLINDLKGMV